MTTTLLTSQTSPRDVQADAIIIGVVQGPGGPLPAPGAEDVDLAMDGGLAATLSVLGAAGKAEERDVRMGQQQGSDWVVEQGLAPGDIVVVDGTQKLKAGTPVQVQPLPTTDTEAHTS